MEAFTLKNRFFAVIARFIIAVMIAVPSAQALPLGQAHVPMVPTVADKLQSYVRQVEEKSGLSVLPKQKEMLANDLRANRYGKLEEPYKTNHKKLYTDTKCDQIKAEWRARTGQEWPRYEGINPRTKQAEMMHCHAHHIIPQQLGGPHEWWNMHPIHPDFHQGGVHGSGSVLNKLVREVKNNG